MSPPYIRVRRQRGGLLRLLLQSVLLRGVSKPVSATWTGVIAYTSFEEINTASGTAVLAPYYDTRGGDSDHELLNHAGQNPVQYLACSEGSAELGFRSFYINTLSSAASGPLMGGSDIGVVGDSRTPSGGGGGGVAPDGSQYYMLEGVNGFVYVSLDSVDISGYSDPTFHCWVHVESSSWEPADLLKVWVADQDGNNELSLFYGTNLDHVTGVNENTWTEYSAASPSFTQATMSFGLQANSAGEEVWIDYYRVTGTASVAPMAASCGCNLDYFTSGCAILWRTGCSATSGACGACLPGYIDGGSNDVAQACLADCAAASTSFCAAKHREACSTTPNTCGPCLHGLAADTHSRSLDSMHPVWEYVSRVPSPAHSNELCAEYAGVIGYSSFEEPLVVGVDSGQLYNFSLGRSRTMEEESYCELVHSTGQNPVGYVGVPVSMAAELGFSTYVYAEAGSTVLAADASNRLLGVIGDATTAMGGSPGASAPSGQKFFRIRAIERFTFVSLSAVSLSEYSDVSIDLMLLIASSAWQADDRVRVWADLASSGSVDSVSILSITDGDIADFRGQTNGIGALGQWTQYGSAIPDDFEAATVHFGGSGDFEMFVDHIRVSGVGPLPNRFGQVAFTSFEEATVSAATMVNHQNPVAYSVASCGHELGFSTFAASGNLYSANGTGVIGDSTTAMGGGGGGAAPHGSQYYMLGSTGEFVYVAMDSVDVSSYSGVTMSGWLLVRSASWEDQDTVKIWASDSNGAEVVLLSGSNLDHDANVTEGIWKEYSTHIARFTVVKMNFGTDSDSSSERMFFDYFRIYAFGQNMLSDDKNCAVLNRCRYPTGITGQCGACVHGYVSGAENGPSLCSIANCSSFSVENGSVNGSTLFGGSISIVCQHCYNLVGPAIRTCSANQSWVPAAEPECQPVELNCISLSGNRTGYAIETGADATTVTGLGTISCATGFHGTPGVVCNASACDTQSSVFIFSGCEVNTCVSGSGNTTGFDVETSAGTTVIGLGSIVCATNFHGNASVRCSTHGGSFVFNGCQPNICAVSSGNRIGYTVANAHADSVDALGTLSCAANYRGSAMAHCSEGGAAFVFSGCVENTCAASGVPHGYHSANISSSTVSGLEPLNCSYGFEGQATAACNTDGENFTFSGCYTTSIECPMFTISNSVLSPDPAYSAHSSFECAGEGTLE
eukprot:COSAG05_NODE_1335_length_5149_cov_4.388515_2_plen_1183_part_01